MIPHYIVFARLPEQGRVKTRLAATLGDEATLALYEAMLRDTLEIVQSRASATNADVMVFVTSSLLADETIRRFAAWLEPNGIDYLNVHLLPQTGDTLGDRMLNAFRVAGERGSLPALILGTDSPTIPESVLTRAEHTLEQHPDTAVIGGTEDGGFYLLGLQHPDESLFFGADYSNDSVFERTDAALRAAYTHVEHLPVWYDVDDAASLERLTREAVVDATVREFHTYRVLHHIYAAQPLSAPASSTFSTSPNALSHAAL
jgi:rSAM/selenodomain-associated transferase 1